MKRLSLFALCALLVSSVLAFAQDTKKKNSKEKVTFLIENMSCDNCIKKIEKNIAFEKGVTDLKCDLPTKTVEVTYKSDKTSKEKLVEAFKKIDYIASEKTDTGKDKKE
jgi:Cu+-exporting ATPase